MDAVQPRSGGGRDDAFVLKLNPASDVVYSTFLGGINSDQGMGIGINQKGGAYVVGNTFSPNFPTMSPLQAAFGGGNGDGFLARIGAAADLIISVAASRETVQAGSDLVYTLTVKNVAPSNATAVTVNSAMTGNPAIVSSTATQGACSSGGSGNVTSALGEMAAQASGPSPSGFAPERRARSRTPLASLPPSSIPSPRTTRRHTLHRSRLARPSPAGCWTLTAPDSPV